MKKEVKYINEGTYQIMSKLAKKYSFTRDCGTICTWNVFVKGIIEKTDQKLVEVINKNLKHLKAKDVAVVSDYTSSHIELAKDVKIKMEADYNDIAVLYADYMEVVL